MHEVSVRELRNHGGEVLDRVTKGEALTVTRDGRPVAELRPLPRPTVSAGALLKRWRSLPDIDVKRLRADTDAALDSSL